jgi:hypothetical protein
MHRFALLLIVATPLPLSAQLAITPDQEIILAQSAAPAAVARDAAVYVFGKTGYERVREGKNGFTCLVNRDSFLEGYEVLKPTCWDAEGSTTIVPQVLFIGKRKAEGATAETVRAEVAARTSAGEFHYPVGHGLAYMLNGDISRYDTAKGAVVERVFPPHLMIYAPGATREKLGFAAGPLPKDGRIPLIYSPNRNFSYIVVRVAADSIAATMAH